MFTLFFVVILTIQKFLGINLLIAVADAAVAAFILSYIGNYFRYKRIQKKIPKGITIATMASNFVIIEIATFFIMLALGLIGTICCSIIANYINPSWIKTFVIIYSAISIVLVYRTNKSLLKDLFPIKKRMFVFSNENRTAEIYAVNENFSINNLSPYGLTELLNQPSITAYLQEGFELPQEGRIYDVIDHKWC